MLNKEDTFVLFLATLLQIDSCSQNGILPEKTFANLTNQQKKLWVLHHFGAYFTQGPEL